MQSALTDGLLLCNPAAAATEKFKQFDNTVIYIVEHSAKGTFGVNLCQKYSQTIIKASSDFPEFSPIRSEDLLDLNVIAGGPVSQTPPWILQPYTQPFEIAFSNPALSLGFSPDAFTYKKPENSCLCGIGSFGWGANQLEKELANSLWHFFPADKALLNTIPFPEPQLSAVKLFLQLRFRDE